MGQKYRPNNKFQARPNTRIFTVVVGVGMRDITFEYFLIHDPASGANKNRSEIFVLMQILDSKYREVGFLQNCGELAQINNMPEYKTRRSVHKNLDQSEIFLDFPSSIF